MRDEFEIKMTGADLADFESEWVEPISTDYHGYDVFQLPPPGQGFAALETLNILEVCAPVHGLDLGELGPTHPDYWHFMVEAKKPAYSDLYAYNADPTALQARGHRVRSVDGSAVGGYQGILFTRDPSLPAPSFGPESIAEDHPVNGVYRAGSDHRKDGLAAGW